VVNFAHSPELIDRGSPFLQQDKAGRHVADNACVERVVVGQALGQFLDLV
jgi:hypothetical protein